MSFLDQSQRWWVIVVPNPLPTARRLYISDSPKPEAWALLYRWAWQRTAKWPFGIVGVGLFALAALTWLPAILNRGYTFPIWVPVLLSILSAAALAVWGLLLQRASGVPFSALPVDVESPDVVAGQLEDLWPDLTVEAREQLRLDMIRVLEQFPADPSPRALQQALISTIERFRYATFGPTSSLPVAS